MKNCSLDQWYGTASSFTWHGNQIVYKEQLSDNETLLMIHGFPTASYDWWKIWSPLAERYSLIAPDMIGFGYSDKPKDFPYSIMRQADLILDLLREKGATEFHILAHDYGDTVAQEILARANESQAFTVKTVCLLNGGIFPEAHHPILIQKLLMSPIGFILSRMLNQQKFEKSFSKVFGADTKLDEQELELYWQLVSKADGHRIAHKIIRYMRERVENRERWLSALQNYPNKLGLINGPEDPISGKVMVERFKEVISEENIWLLEGIGHYPQVEAPVGVLEAYFEFINQ
ncbi:MAG: alpha/beta hydrolase [Reichenbachiella sp.]|uniref:alpha/beta fold hydrolase n=1 Tax=Reichenbachiella sp. TaxID=2184521 RepID=UPI003299CBD7